ncbi:MAG: BamA/TamA family outer membrane protein [Bacteroidales bacterium]|nr:BamA/TamA family outer membrane protein [Bacteroidales bacterium]
MKHLLTLAAIAMLPSISMAQTDSANVKKGWKFGGALPAIAFNTDIGFRYGILGYIYDYGDGSSYPDFKKSLYAEWSQTTKGGAKYNLEYEDTQLFGKNLHLNSDLLYATEKCFDFYGFNGYETHYDSALEDQDSPDYISRAYYRIGRKMWRVVANLQGNTGVSHLKWLAGLMFYNIEVTAPDIEKLNKGKSGKDILPDATPETNLYLNYVANGHIKADEADGGTVTILKAGIIYDSRDVLMCPSRGFWNELYINVAPSFLGSGDTYTSITASVREYFPVVGDRFILTYRLAFNTLLGGKMPYYIMPFYSDTKFIYDGIGGVKTVRGLKRDRLQGEGYLFGNFEARWKFLKTKVFNQDLYLALSGFYDAGTITNTYSSTAPKYKSESLHNALGGGFRIALNNNFIVSVDFGRCLNKEDGDNALYIDLGWLW